MFESAELDHKIDKETFDQMMPRLREDLLNAQFDLVEAKEFPVIILIAGADGDQKKANSILCFLICISVSK